MWHVGPFGWLKKPKTRALLWRKALPTVDIQPYFLELFQLGEGVRYKKYEKHWFLQNNAKSSNHSNNTPKKIQPQIPKKL